MIGGLYTGAKDGGEQSLRWCLDEVIAMPALNACMQRTH
jgi:hypothetical protein